jgi:hypothetical protein
MSVDSTLMPGMLQGGPRPELEIEIESPEALTIETEDGGVLIDFDPGASESADEFGDNLAEFMDENDMQELASDLISDYKSDRQSRKEWEKSYIQGLELLGMNFEERNTPWKGACGVFHPMLSEAVVRFQSQTIQEIFPASGPAKTTIEGKPSKEKDAQAIRVQNYLNYKATKEMVEYRSETEKLLFSMPLAGSAFRKVYYDPALGREAAMFVPAEDFVVSYGVSDLETCGRATHVMKRTPNQIRKLQVKGFYRDVELPETKPDIEEITEKYNDMTGSSVDHDVDDRNTLLEMMVDVDLKGWQDPAGIALPYVITIEEHSREILGIRRNWRQDDPDRLKRQHVVHYPYIPGVGFYGFGLVHMIGGLSKSATSLLRQLVDSGTLANLPGGLKTRGLRIKGDDSPIMPGEFRDVDVPGGAIRDNLAFLPYKEPSSVLYQLLGDIVQEGRRFASAADVKAADMNAEAPVGTTLAILEREMKVMSAIQARIHASMGAELNLLAELIKDHGPEEYPYEIEGEFTVREDFDDRIDVFPVSDPNAGTMAQRIMQYQAALQLAATAPQIYDIPLLHRQMLEVLGIQEADKVVPTDDDMKPTDPVTETMNIINGEPVKAFLYQDHEAHIQAHMAAAQNPAVMEILQHHPNVEAVQAAAAAHLAEHVAFAYRQKIEQELGVPLPGPEEPLPEDIELRLSRLVAPAAAQLTGKAEQQKKAEEDAKKQEDPIIQMQQQELEIKDRLASIKEKEVQLKREAERLKDERERDKQESAERIAEGHIAAKVHDTNVQAEDAKTSRESKELTEGYKIGIGMVKEVISERNENNQSE